MSKTLVDKKPLVTFALFAYNQEKFIQEAVEAAFAQTYQPLEIIISDDGSSDKTFEIILSLVQHYQGPHTVKAVQTKSNQGILSHVLSVVNQSHGELIVVAAGDDLSAPSRVESLCKAWLKTGSWGLISKFDRINEAGKTESEGCISEMRDNPIRDYFSDGSTMTLIHGATAAYDKLAFTLLRHDAEGVMNEDGVMSFLLHRHGKYITFVEQSLVKYRSHPSALSNSNTVARNAEQILLDEKRSARFAKGFIKLNNLFLKIADELSQSDPEAYTKILRPNIEKQLNFYTVLNCWMDACFTRRMWFLLISRRWREVRWMLPRVFGINFFIKLKLIIFKIKKLGKH